MKRIIRVLFSVIALGLLCSPLFLSEPKSDSVVRRNKIQEDTISDSVSSLDLDTSLGIIVIIAVSGTTLTGAYIALNKKDK